MLIRVAELESRKIFTEEEVIVGREEDLEGHWNIEANTLKT